jgi:thiamine transport system permease protein
MTEHQIKSLLTFVAVVWMIAFTTAFVFFPLASIFTLESVCGLFDPLLIKLAKFTVYQASVSTVFSLFLGLPAGLLLGRALKLSPYSRIPALFSISFGMPTVVVTLSWADLLGRSGIFGFLQWSYSFTAVLLAHVFLSAPWVALAVAQSSRGILDTEYEASSGLGAGSVSQFRFITWPQIKWAFTVSSAQVFSLSLMSFVIVLLLGGGPPIQTLETELYARFRASALSRETASCALLQLFLTVFPWLFISIFQPRSVKLTKISGTASCKQPRGATANTVGLKLTKAKSVIFASAVGVFFLFPYISIFKRDFVQLNWSEVASPLRASILLAIPTAFLSVITAGAALLVQVSLLTLGRGPDCECMRDRSVRFLSFLHTLVVSIPAGISPLVLGFSAWKAYGHLEKVLSHNFMVVVGLQSALFFPVVYRLLLPLVLQYDRGEWESARVLGATPFTAFQSVIWPRLRGGVVSALALVTGASLGEVGLVSLFQLRTGTNLPVLITRWMEAYRFEEAQGLAAVLFLLVAFLNWISFEVSSVFSNRSSIRDKRPVAPCSVDIN